MITQATLRARRDDLIAQLENGKQQLETLDRQLCMLAGAIAELAALIDLADVDATTNGVELEENRHAI